jgi:hypothetical protein
MNEQIYPTDWSEALWCAIGIFLLYHLIRAYIRHYDAKNQERLTETERNSRMMKSMEQDCQYDQR